MNKTKLATLSSNSLARGLFFYHSYIWLKISHGTCSMDEVVNVLPIHYSDAPGQNVHVHQFPLLRRPLQIPPSAALTGKRIRARVKTVSRKLEIHVPVDTRPDVWSQEKSKTFGAARLEIDREQNLDMGKAKQREVEDDPRLTEVQLQSEQITQKGVYMLGIVRDGEDIANIDQDFDETFSSGRLHLVPISQTHQFRPIQPYLDVMSRKSRRLRAGAGSDSDSNDGPPLDPDEPAPVITSQKKEKKSVEAKEVQVSVRKTGDDKGSNLQGGISAARREMLLAIRAEEEEPWQSVEFCGTEVGACFLIACH